MAFSTALFSKESFFAAQAMTIVNLKLFGWVMTASCRLLPFTDGRGLSHLTPEPPRQAMSVVGRVRTKRFPKHESALECLNEAPIDPSSAESWG